MKLRVLERAQIITVGKTYAPGKFGHLISVRREIIGQYWRELLARNPFTFSKPAKQDQPGGKN